MEDSVNTLIDDLLRPTTEVTRAIAAVAQGDLLETVRLDVDGRPLRGRVPPLGDDRQHDDPAARRVHVGGDARGARGRHRRQARRPGAGAGRQRRLEGPHRQRQPDGQQPDRAGAQHRRGDDRRRQRRPLARRSPSTCAARSCSSRKPSTRWSTSCARSRRRSRAWRARSAPKASWAARRSCRAWPARGRT